ncbi:phosphotransferase [Saccharothrix sp. ALI-22-I]|uniref:phosphotransferase n=1 Tax=Saccharothrix sp. ALI-22-I TaxID=1933778 RepID=UPI0009FD234E|nr:phosphotransferase [Saccharothrix sp. ALI-22-I]
MPDVDELVREVVELVRHERGLALTLVGRFARGCRPSVLVGCEQPVSGLVSRLRASAAAAPLPERAPDDLVHFDLGPANVLVDGGRVAAVLDWRSCRAGDASYDLVTVDWDLAA